MSVQPTTIPSKADELWFTRCSIATAFGVAQERGVFAKEFGSQERLSWRSIQESDDLETRQSHFTHLKERSFRHGGNVPALWARSRGADTKLIGLTWLPTADLVLALPESRIASAEDLRGKRLLVIESPESEIDVWKATTLRTYEAALSSAGLDFDDVTLVPLRGDRLQLQKVEPGESPATASGGGGRVAALKARYKVHRETLLALVRGDADAAVSHAHFALELVAFAGANIVFDQGSQSDPLARVNLDVPDALTVSGRLLEEEPEQVVRVVARLLETHAWAREHPDEAIASLARELDAPQQLLRATHGEDVSAGFDLNLGEQALAGLASQKDFLLRHGFLERDFDLDEWIDPAPLARAHELLGSSPALAGVGSPTAATAEGVNGNVSA